jgi:hypothetical protein
MQLSRPVPDGAIRYRLRLWAAAIDAARRAKRIPAGCDLYLKRIAGLVTVAHGGYADVSDEVMAQWLGRHPRTAQRYRSAAIKAGIIKALTRGKDHRPCLVQPILPDGPVYSPKGIAVPDNSGVLSTTKESSGLTESLATETTPIIPQSSTSADDAAQEEGENIDVREEKEIRPAPSIGVVTFAELWLAAGQIGRFGYAAGQWDQLGRADQIAISELVRAGRLATGGTYLGNWLKHRGWETLPAVRYPPTNHLGRLGKALIHRIGAEKFGAWFGKAEIAIDEPDFGVISVPLAFIRSRIMQDFGEALAECWGKRIDVIVRLPNRAQV